MPDISFYHPQIVHFVIALLVVGVLLRLISLSSRLTFAAPAALLLILLGAGASVLAVESGDDAHGLAERIPGVKGLVEEHEEWGERTRNVFLGIAVIELAAVIPALRKKKRLIYLLSALVGLAGLYCVYETGEHGGKLVYSYAGGVGVRSGDRADVSRLLLAGLYQKARLERSEGKPLQAANLFEEMAERFPQNVGVQLLRIESILQDRKDPQAALKSLDGIQIPGDDRRLNYRFALLNADALAADGKTSQARAALDDLLARFPDDRRIRSRLDELKK